MRAFAEKVLTKTGGQVTVEVFPSSQLGNPTEIIRSTQMGAVDMCMAQPASMASMGAKELGVLVLPYIFKSYDQRMNVLFGPIGRELLDKISTGNMQLKGFGYFPDGARNFFTVKGKPIRTIEDVKGMKLRVQPLPLDTDMALALGASPTPIAFAELYSALQAGVVDGAEQPVTSYYAGKYHEVSSFLTLDEHTYNTLVILFSELSWKKRTPQLQKILTESWDEAILEFKNVILKGEEEALVKIAAAGIEVIRPADRQKWIDAMKPVYTKHAVGLESLIGRIQAAN
jgi:tripartite ATP-independent transporter DctP family solute receptor